MRKEEFFNELEYLLQDIPDSDREDALDYYRDYLAEAGTDDEEKAIEGFGSPERVAAIIRADLSGNLEDGGSFTETGYEDERFRDPNYQVARRLDLPDETSASGGQDGAAGTGAHQGGGFQDGGYRSGGYQSGVHQDSGYRSGGYQDGGHQNSGYRSGMYQEEPQAGRFKERYTKSRATDPSGKGEEKRPWTSRPLKLILWIILIIAASPFILGAGGIAVGAVTGIVAIIFGILACIVCLTAAAFIVGVILLVLGVIFLFSSPFDGLLLFGIAVIGIGCGLIGAVILYAIMALLFPLIWKGITSAAGLVAGLWKGVSRP